jgi:putative oxidoreductase
MKNYTVYAQLYLRLAVGFGFISAVLDRVGWLGPAGAPNIAWGGWDSFLKYTHVLLPFLPEGISNFIGLLATLAEVILGLLVIVGYKTRYVAIGSFLLTLIFAISMAVSLGLQSPFNYSVFAVSGGSLLLSAIPEYKWSIDKLLAR